MTLMMSSAPPRKSCRYSRITRRLTQLKATKEEESVQEETEIGLKEEIPDAVATATKWSGTLASISQIISKLR